jgi:hypothetical protein
MPTQRTAAHVGILFPRVRRVCAACQRVPVPDQFVKMLVSICKRIRVTAGRALISVQELVLAARVANAVPRMEWYVLVDVST